MCNDKKQHCHGEHGEEHAHTHHHGHPHAHDGHSHPHAHEHSHPHDHGKGEHCNSHEEKKGHCGCGCGEPVEKKDEEILGILLDHWVAHNKDHAGEYSIWVEKMNKLGKNAVAEDLIEAIALMAEADKHLIQAKEDLVK